MERQLSGIGLRPDVRLFDDLRPQLVSPSDGRVEIVDLEPQHDAMSRGRRVRIDEVGVVLRVPRVQLKGKRPERKIRS
jgi:hypothetical protein